MLRASAECAQVFPETLGIAIMKERLDFRVRAPPNWNGADKQSAPRCRQGHQTATAVPPVCCDFDQTAALQRFESGRQGGSIHGEQRSHRGHRRRLRAVQRHQERELSVGQAYGVQRVIEAPCQRARRSLNVKAEARVADQKGGLKRRLCGG